MAKWLRFAAVGGFGFIVDSLVLTLMYSVFETPVFISRVLAFVCAASATWLGNRLLTFAGDASQESRFYQWIRYLLCSGVGAIPNILLFMILVNWLGEGGAGLYIALVCGVFAGMVANYLLYSRYVFLKAS